MAKAATWKEVQRTADQVAQFGRWTSKSLAAVPPGVLSFSCPSSSGPGGMASPAGEGLKGLRLGESVPKKHSPFFHS
jgi:hypothetical protein